MGTEGLNESTGGEGIWKGVDLAGEGGISRNHNIS